VPSAAAHRERVVAALRRRCAPRGFEVRLDRVDDATASYPFS